MKNNIEMALKNREWKEYFFAEIFKVYSSSSGIDKNKLILKVGKIPYVTRSEKNNGIDLFVDKQNEKYNTDNSNTITIGLDTQTVFYQSNIFYTGQNIQILENNNLNRFVANFLIPLIKRQMEKFNWGGNGATLTRLKRSKIVLPINSQGEPDYEFMEVYMRAKEQEKINAYKNYITKRIKELENSKTVVSLKEKDWKEFKVADVFNVGTGANVPKKFLKKGKIPRISATEQNNGVVDFTDLSSHKNFRTIENFISVSFLGAVFYHSYKASLDMKIHSIQIKEQELNKYLAEFIVIALKRSVGNTSYGNQVSSSDLPNKKVYLPVNLQEEPDYEFMENYIKRLELKKIKKYLVYKETK